MYCLYNRYELTHHGWVHNSGTTNQKLLPVFPVLPHSYDLLLHARYQSYFFGGQGTKKPRNHHTPCSVSLPLFLSSCPPSTLYQQQHNTTTITTTTTTATSSSTSSSTYRRRPSSYICDNDIRIGPIHETPLSDLLPTVQYYYTFGTYTRREEAIWQVLRQHNQYRIPTENKYQIPTEPDRTHTKYQSSHQEYSLLADYRFNPTIKSTL